MYQNVYFICEKYEIRVPFMTSIGTNKLFFQLTIESNVKLLFRGHSSMINIHILTKL